MATVTEKVKETLVGSEEDGSQELSAQTRSEFQRNALEDEATGERYLDEKAFINAVATEGED